MLFVVINFMENKDLKIKFRNKAKLNLKRRILSENKNASNLIFKKIKSASFFLKSNKIHTFVSKKNEPNTFIIIEWLLKKNKEVVIPCIDNNESMLKHSRIYSLNQLSLGRYGVFDIPFKNRKISNINNIELILVPGLAFDLLGGRLGYGKGFYDRFLEKTKAIKIGVSFQCQIYEKLPLEKHDIKMNYILTEKFLKKI